MGGWYAVGVLLRGVALTATATALSGCSGKIDHAKAQALLVGRATDSHGTVASAACPSDVAVKAQATFDCKVKMSDGSTGTWTVTIHDDQGLISASPDGFNSDASDIPSSHRHVGATVTQATPHGGRLRVTLVSWQPTIDQPSGSSDSHVAGVTLRLVNVGRVPIATGHPLTYYAILTLDSTGGADEVPHAAGPCGGAFYEHPIHLAPGQSAQGCIPYAVPSQAVSFGFGIGDKTTRWDLP